MRSRVPITTHRLLSGLLLAIVLGTAGPSSGLSPRPRLGLEPALVELDDGSFTQVPGPHILLEDTPYVSAQRRRFFVALQNAALHKAQHGAVGLHSEPDAGFLELLVNDPGTDSPGLGETQNEPTVVASGDTVVCGFNDSRGFFFTMETISGYAYSLDAGETWTDGGSLPISGTAGASEILLGEPALVTDGQGRWFYISLYDVGNGTNGRGSGDYGLSISTGTFQNGVLVWGPPVLFAGGMTTGSDLGLTHAAYDPDLDHLYVTYTNFSYPLQGWGQIEVVTLANHATQLLYQVVLQPEQQEINNGGSQVAVGPAGEVYVAWGGNLLDGNGQGPAVHRITRSTQGGTAFSAPVDAVTVIESWFSNPPGSARTKVNPSFPALAVATQPGPHQGRVYLTWQEGVEMVFDAPYDSLAETGLPHDTPATAQVIPDSMMNVRVHGSLPGTDTSDFYRFHGNAGEHFRAINFVESGLLSMRFRLWCANPDGISVDTLLTNSALGIQSWTAALITLPYTGDYFAEISRENYSGNYKAYLRRTTTTLPSVAIDHRDIVMASSPDGISNWSSKIRVNDDLAPADQSWPNIVTDAAGVHVSWYDRRFDPRCRALADLVMASSLDGGTTWTPNVRLTSQSSWWQVGTETVPSFGDHARMASHAGRLHVPWTDGRLGTPDVRSSALVSGVELQLPDSVVAVEGQGLGLVIGVQTGVAPDDTLSVQVTSLCGSTLPDSSWVLTGLPILSQTSVTYDPQVTDDLVNAAPCTLSVDAWSLRTGVHVQRGLRVFADGLIPVTLQDFSATWTVSGVVLRWRAQPTNRFEVWRGTSAEGPWEPVSGLAQVVAGSGDGFEARDGTAPSHSTVWYRLVGVDEDGTRESFGPYRVSTAAPGRVRLMPAFPNPFNPNTLLRFELPQRKHATLRILDARGRRVSILADGVFDAGRHGITWDGRLQSGAAAASGIYFAQLTVEGRHSYTRLVLVR